MKKKSIWKKSLVFSLIAAMVLSLMPAEAFLTEVKADESYGNIVNSENGVGGSVKSDHILSDNMKPESLQMDNDSKDGQVLPAVISRGTLTDKDVFFEDTETSGRAEESDQVIS